MKAPSIFIAALACSASVFMSRAQSEELLSYNNVSASVSDDYRCGTEAKVRLDTASEESYRKSRVDMQKMSEIVKTYLWLDCKEIESVEFEAYADGSDEVVYRASIEKKSEWFLQAKDVDNSDVDKSKDSDKTPDKEELKSKAPPQGKDEASTSSDEPQATATSKPANTGGAKGPSGKAKNTSKYKSLEALESAAKTSPEAQLEMAKGLLDLPGKDESIDFPDDQAGKGLEILEKLASEGNADAMQILSDAYSSDKKFELNIPLIESLTGRPMTQGEDIEQRGAASAGLTLEAAAKGSELAVNSLEEAGQAGSSMSYYALGMMYMLDKAMKMPYQEEFLTEELNMDVAGAGGSGNVDVGLHFLGLAAESGNSDAQELLSDMEIDFKPPSSSSGSSSNPSLIPTLSTSPGGSSGAKTAQGKTKTTQGQANTTSPASANPSNAQSASPNPPPSQPAASSSASAVAVGTPSANAQTSGAASGGSSNRSAYSEALIASGALNDILDARSAAESAEASSHSASSRGQKNTRSQAGNASGSSSATTSSGSSGGKGRSGAQGAASNPNAARANRRTTRPYQRSGRSDENMNTGKNEAEIID